MKYDVDVIDGTPVFGKVINQEETKLFRAKSVLAFLDGPVYNFDKAHVEIYNPVPVYSEENEQLGFANIQIVEINDVKRMVADISIKYACEERLLTETRQERFYPKLFGTIRTHSYDFDFERPVEVSLILVNGIVLSRDKPTDERILAFGDRVL